jgi:MoaA/NifB/PqqE/SkfB family radical SAM enzyme
LVGLDLLLQRIRATNVPKIILTGTRTDPQLYKYEHRLLRHLRSEVPDVHLSLHTNGALAVVKMVLVNMYDSMTVSYNSFDPQTFRFLHGTRCMPDLRAIVAGARIPVKLSCVVTDDNRHELLSYISAAADLGIRRIAMRHVFGKAADATQWNLFGSHVPSRQYAGQSVYEIDGVEVTHWKFEHVDRASLNLFPDGTISDSYLLADAKQA